MHRSPETRHPHPRSGDIRAQRAGASIDTGLRGFMLAIYDWMALGVALTALVALAVASQPALLETVAAWSLLLLLALLGLGLLAPRLIVRGSVASAHACYWSYAALWGLLLAPALAVYAAIDPMMLVRAFFITAGMFAGMSLLGYTSKRNLSGLGTFCSLAAIGLLIAMLVNVFLIESSLFSFMLSAAVVLVFAGMTAWETQVIKEMYLAHDSQEIATRKGILGALMLYGSFMTMFVHVLNLLGLMGQD